MNLKNLVSVLTLSLLTCYSAYAGGISGKVTLTGKAPAARTQPTDADPKCKAHHAQGVKIENYVVDAKGGLANVVVYVKEGLAGKKFPAPTATVTLDQAGCLYSPMVLAVQAGQTIVIQNSDDTMHNVNCQAKKNPAFNLGQPKKGDKTEKKFDKAEVFIKFKCDVHPWMSAYVAVLENPCFALTGADGAYKIADLPDGEYTLVAAHPKAGESKPVKVKVAGGDAVAPDFTFAPKP